MLIVVASLVAALSAEPSPAPVSAAPPTPLKVIGQVEALTVCTTIVVHANGAISDALDNDQTLAIVTKNLRSVDIDGATGSERGRRLNELMAFTTKLRTDAAAGDAEVKRLRDLAAASPEPRKHELKAFADALGGALFRQRHAGVDLAKALVIGDGREAVVANGTQRAETDTAFGSAARLAAPLDPPTPTPRLEERHYALNPLLRAVADDLEARGPAILHDEGIAADHSLAATTGC